MDEAAAWARCGGRMEGEAWAPAARAVPVRAMGEAALLLEAGAARREVSAYSSRRRSPAGRNLSGVW